jgi:hypothetical protein
MEITEGLDLIVCRDCGNKTASIITIDEIPCSCGEIIPVKYISCTCGYSYRMAGDIFIDGSKIDISQVASLLEDITEFFDGHDIFCDTLEDKPMESFIHKCLKCGELAAEISPGMYECTVCGFSWETSDVL